MPKKRTVGQGESIPSIALSEGMRWKTIWDHPDNAELKKLRKDPNVLFEGDVVTVPDQKPPKFSKPVNSLHRFVRKVDPTKLVLTLTRLGAPRKNEPYELIVDHKTFKGTTDANGRVEHLVPGDARNARLVLKGGKEQHELRIGHLDPVDTVSGTQQRLRNLGHDCDDLDGELGPATQAALRAFQRQHGLMETGALSPSTQDALKAQHS